MDANWESGKSHSWRFDDGTDHVMGETTVGRQPVNECCIYVDTDVHDRRILHSHVDAFDSKNSRRQLVRTRIRNWATVLRYCPSSMSLRQPSCSRYSFSIDTSLASVHCCSSSLAFDHKQQTAFLDVLMLLCACVCGTGSALCRTTIRIDRPSVWCVFTARNGMGSIPM